ncbi:MAG: hypothetical protein IJA23_01790 [Clostridia bacterium]|nr:hypothetical protein [Clostridia bacterium]
MKSSKILLNIMSVVCFLYGALYSFTLVFIPIGVYCFIAGRRFSFKAEHLDDKMFLSDNDFKNYVIFSSIVCFPLGLLSIIPYMILTSNNVKISTHETSSIKVETVEVEKENELKEETKTENKEEKPVEEVTAQKEDEMTEEEKQAKFKKLQNFRDKGIITEEELELAREQLFGKK